MTLLNRIVACIILLCSVMFFSACDSSHSADKKATDAANWIVRDGVCIGNDFELGKVYARKSDAFQYELFFRGGVVTSAADRLPDAITAAPVPAGGFRDGFPPEFGPSEAEYKLFARITPETDMETFALAMGSPVVARPVFSVDVMSGVTEYFWTLPNRYILGVITKDSKPFEKLLIQGPIPPVWR